MNKTKQDREEIALGVILIQKTNWFNVELVLKNFRKVEHSAQDPLQFYNVDDIRK